MLMMTAVMILPVGCTENSDLQNPVGAYSGEEKAKKGVPNEMGDKGSANTLNDPIRVAEAFINAYNNKDEKQLLQLSTQECAQQIMEDKTGIQLKLKNASIVAENDKNYAAVVQCEWDKSVEEQLSKQGLQGWSFLFLVREKGVLKVTGYGSGYSAEQ